MVDLRLARTVTGTFATLSRPVLLSPDENPFASRTAFCVLLTPVRGIVFVERAHRGGLIVAQVYCRKCLGLASDHSPCPNCGTTALSGFWSAVGRALFVGALAA